MPFIAKNVVFCEIIRVAVLVLEYVNVQATL